MKNNIKIIIGLLLVSVMATAQWYDFIGQIQWDTGATKPVYTKGMMFWNSLTDTVSYYKNDSEERVDLKEDKIDNAIYARFDAENRDETDFTNFSITTASPLNGEAMYSVYPFPASIPDVVAPLGALGYRNTVKFKYKLGSGQVKATLSGGGIVTPIEILLDPADNGRGSIEYTPTNQVPLELTFTEEDTVVIFRVDDIVFSDAPPETKEFTVVNSIRLVGNDGRAITANTESIPFGDALDAANAKGWTYGANGSTTTSGNYYTVQYDNSKLDISLAVSMTASVNNRVVLYKNGSQLSALVSSFSANTKIGSYNSKVGEFSRGDKIAFTFDGDATLTSANHLDYLNITETATKEGTVRGSDVTDADLENNFSARIANNGATATITSKNVEFIESVTRTATGIVDVVFKSGFFSEIPAISIQNTEDPSNGTTVTSVDNVTLAGFTSKIRKSSGSSVVYEDVNFDIEVSRQESDYRSKANYIDNLILENPDGEDKTVYLKDVKPNGTDAGTFTNGAWRTRTLNTVAGDASLVSLSSNQFTLQEGKYEVDAIAPAFRVARHKIRLRNITDGITAELGSSEQSEDSASVSTISSLFTTLTVEYPTTFELQHIANATKAGNGFGISSNDGSEEIYSRIKITKKAKSLGVMQLNGSGTVHKTDGTEYLTGEYMDIGGVKKPIWARTWIVGADITTTTTLATGIPSDIMPINLIGRLDTAWDIVSRISGSNYYEISFNRVSGTITAYVGGSYNIIAGTNFTLEYYIP